MFINQNYINNCNHISGILPSHLEVCDFVKRQRQEQYEDLKQTLITIHRINEWTPLPHLQLRMFLIEQGRLPLKENNMVGFICST